MAEFIAPPIETDPDVLAQASLDYLQSVVPGYVPSEGNFEVILALMHARMVAQLRDVSSLVPVSIFRYFGKTLMDVQPVDASQAQGTTTWTMIDNLGYTIPAGTQIQIRDASGTFYPFTTMFDIIVPAGSTATVAGEVQIEAVFSGSASSGLSGAAELIDVLNFVETVDVVGTTTGGEDAMTDADYLNHLVEQLRLMAPRPILPDDFAEMAMNVAGVGRAVTIDGYKPGTNEVQQISVDATGGTFKVTFGAQQTAALAYNITAANLRLALEGLSSINVGNVAVTGGPGDAGATTPYLITFKNVLGYANQAPVTTDATLLTGTVHTATVTTVTGGVASTTGVERYASTAVTDDQGQPLSGSTKQIVADYLESLREINFVAPVIDPTYQSIDVQVTVKALPNYDSAQVQSDVLSALSAYLNPANWGTVLTEGAGSWSNQVYVRYLEVATLVNDVRGVDYIVSLQTAKHGASPNTVDILLPGTVPLPTAGSFVVTVT